MANYRILEGDLSQEDLLGVARVHRQELNQGFLSSLGDRALIPLFTFAAQSPTAVLLVAKDADTGGVVGFLLGAVNTRAFYREFMRRASIKAFLSVVPKLLSLRRIIKIFETLFYPGKQELKNLPQAELLDIVVARGCQGSGLGKELFARFCTSMQQKGIGEFRVTTGETLVQAHRFYERLGAKWVSSIEVHRGQKTRVYTYTINSPAGPKAAQ